MRRVGAFEAEGFGAQQYRAAPAREPNKPDTESDKDERYRPELPLLETGKDLDRVSELIVQAVKPGEKPGHSGDHAGCEQDGPLEARLVLFHRPRLDGFPDQILSGPQPRRYADIAI
jgi:hypothetical protein